MCIGEGPTHLLAKAVLFSNIPRSWTKNMPHDVTQAILLDLNNILFPFSRKKELNTSLISN